MHRSQNKFEVESKRKFCKSLSVKGEKSLKSGVKGEKQERLYIRVKN